MAKPAKLRGERGNRGARGARGSRGSTGPRGQRGPSGKSISQTDILAAVDDQFEEIRKQLSSQLTRTAQMQAELDRTRREVVEVNDRLAEVHAVLKQLLVSE